MNGLLATVIICVCLILDTHDVKGEVFTALAHMKQVLEAEQSIAYDLNKYIAKEEERLGKLKTLAADFEKHSRDALLEPEMHLGNPLNAFLLMKRFTTDWDVVVQDLLHRNSSEEFLDSINVLSEKFPNQEDLNGAAIALLRLQDTYSLSTEQLAKGELQGLKNSPELSANDCFELGRLSYNKGDYYHGILWLEESLQRLGKECSPSADEGKLLDYLAFSVYKQGNIAYAQNLTVRWLEIEPDHARAKQNLRYYNDMIAEADEKKRIKGDTEDSDAAVKEEFKNDRPLDDYRGSNEFKTYEALCRGEQPKLIPLEVRRKLVCRLRRDNPIFILTPAKEELLYAEPNLYFYHDVMTKSEVEKVKELATPKLNRATVQNPRTGVLETAFYRVSESAWLKDSLHPLVAQLTRKTAALADLDTYSVEELQVLNYGIGGHYEPHYDFARENEKNTFDDWRGNRIATAIFYMTDVQAGGCTVFPELGVSSCPEARGMALWYNLKKSGKGDYMTRHAGCPVLAGDKWVCNKWYHERGNEFMRQCGLSEDE